jgi:hypothetical protein
LACHALAFAYFGGVPGEILYDNMRTAFQPDAEGIWRPTKRLAALAVHYGFTPKRCRVRRPETKGKVERTIGYLDNNFWPRMEGETLSLAGLNDQVRGWLATADTKKLSGFDESRAERFACERPLLQELSTLPFDARKEVPVQVNRESMIRYETNSYSVPPEHIGQLLLLKVHPFDAEGEIFSSDGSIRCFPLYPVGSKTKRFFPEDHEALRKRWDADRSRLARVRRPKARVEHRNDDVEVRSPAVYDGFFSDQMAVAT